MAVAEDWHAQGRRRALSDAIACGTCIISGNCDARSRALRLITFWTPHAGHASASAAPCVAAHACATARARDPDAQPSQASSHSAALRNSDLLRAQACAPLSVDASERMMKKTKKHQRLSCVLNPRTDVNRCFHVHGTAPCWPRRRPPGSCGAPAVPGVQPPPLTLGGAGMRASYTCAKS